MQQSAENFAGLQWVGFSRYPPWTLSPPNGDYRYPIFSRFYLRIPAARRHQAPRSGVLGCVEKMRNHDNAC